MKTSSTASSVTQDRRSWQSGLALACALLCAIALLHGIARWTAAPIEAARAARLQQLLAEVLPAVDVDNDPLLDVERQLAPDLGPDGELTMYPLRQEGRTLGAVLQVEAPDGYSGPIQLLIGLTSAGTISGVRVMEHRETPGLGDRIERQRSDWITQFDQRSLERSPGPEAANAWRVVRSGTTKPVAVNTDDARREAAQGTAPFDALTGATITSTAIVGTVHRSLIWFDQNRHRIVDHD